MQSSTDLDTTKSASIRVYQFGNEENAFVLSVSRSTTIGSIKDSIFAHISLQPSAQTLVLNDVPLLDDAKSLDDYGVKDGASLTLLRKVLGIAVTASRDQTAKIWNLNTGECVQTLAGHADHVHIACFSADGGWVLTASSDRTAKLWNASTGTCIATFEGHRGAVISAVFSTDSSSVLTASSDYTAKIWSTTSQQCVQTLAAHTNSVTSAVFAADNMSIVTASLDKTVKLWNARSGECTLTYARDCIPKFAHYSLDNTFVLIIDYSVGDEQIVHLWNATNNEHLHELKGHRNAVTSVALAPDGASFVTTSLDRTAKIYDADGECKLTLRGHVNWVRSANYSSDGKLLLTAGNDRRAKLWNTSSGECLQTLVGHVGAVTYAEFLVS